MTDAKIASLAAVPVSEWVLMLAEDGSIAHEVLAALIIERDMVRRLVACLEEIEAEHTRYIETGWADPRDFSTRAKVRAVIARAEAGYK